MRNLVLLVAIFSVFTGIAQSTPRTPESWFDDLTDLYYDGDYWPALLGFERFLAAHPYSELRPRAMYNRASLLRELGKSEEAIIAFKEIMKSDFDELEPYGGIMEQYALFKNRSAAHLAELYLEARQYDKAETYVYLYDKVYPYKHFCGNELTASAIYKASLYARVYFGQGKSEKAIKTLLPHVFYNGLADNGQITELLGEYLPKTYDRDQMIAALEEAIGNFRPKNKEFGYLKLYGVKIPVQSYAFYDWQYPVTEDVENLSWNAKLSMLLENHPVFGRYFNL
ncbi:Tetratricopeptide repeat-containing protein [Robiginitalea myxolifaciens]|uniref:Tetratricopeptide repeat-containing protein n=1 Tax=Robiginitalea myxolifaciens TaxID=400055 RepID=A0A1I6GD59_9FLAO|nr:tetratricopeptide repeat protein [Robiginitalea myxolifaciens]SFR40132.1 Tetratricopeptide repeat-containing protein [Robiginitalea myxolifaciens]